jgi:hypothetical protein
LRDKDTRLFASEVGNFFLARTAVCKIVSKIPGVRITRKPRFLSWFREEVFCEFQFDGVHFEAWEPYGDSDRYWIGPVSGSAWPLEEEPQIERVREAFVRAHIWRPDDRSLPRRHSSF